MVDFNLRYYLNLFFLPETNYIHKYIIKFIHIFCRALRNVFHASDISLGETKSAYRRLICIKKKLLRPKKGVCCACKQIHTIRLN